MRLLGLRGDEPEPSACQQRVRGFGDLHDVSGTQTIGVVGKVHVERPDEAYGAHGLGSTPLGLLAGETTRGLHLALALVHLLRAGVRQSRVRIRSGFAGSGHRAMVGHEVFRVAAGLGEE